MDELKPCQQCDQKHKCKEVYQQLGNTQGPSVAFKAVVAFLLPLLIFIVSLAAFEVILARITNVKELRIAVSFLLALLLTFVMLLIIKIISRKYLGKNE